MEDFNDAMEALKQEIKEFTQVVQVYQQNKSNAVELELQCKKIQTMIDQSSSLPNQLKGSDKQKATTQFQQLKTQFKQLTDRVQTTQDAISLPNQYDTAASRLGASVQLTDDTKRMGHETLELTQATKEQIRSQNEQMKRIGQTAQGIGANTEQSDALVAEMYRKEKIVNWVIFGVDILFVASWALAFCIFHHVI